jgi:hypothetical protein
MVMWRSSLGMAMGSANQKSFSNVGGDRSQTPGTLLHWRSYVVITTIVVDICCKMLFINRRRCRMKS